MPAPDPVELHREAWEHQRRGDLQAAIRALREAIEVFTHEDGPESLDAANLSTELAAILERTNRYDEAAAAAGRAIETLAPVEDPEPDLATILVRAHAIRSMALRAMGRFDEARRHMLESVRVSEQTAGPRDPQTAAALTGLGVFYKYSGEFDLAEAAYRRALDILLPIHGEDSPGMVQLYHNLGGLAHSRRDFAAGIPWARKAWEIARRTFGEGSEKATVEAVALAGLLDELGPTAESERIYRDALEVWRRVFGYEHHEIATTLHNLAALRRDLGDVADAVDLFGRAHAMKARLLGDASPDTAVSAACLAQMLAESGDASAALTMARRALAAYESNCSPDHPERVACADLVRRLERRRSVNPAARH